MPLDFQEHGVMQHMKCEEEMAWVTMRILSPSTLSQARVVAVPVQLGLARHHITAAHAGTARRGGAEAKGVSLGCLMGFLL